MSLTVDHKPSNPEEAKRIKKEGGYIYQEDDPNAPQRVMPGRLAISRAFGDIECKLPQYGGTPKVITAEPEIRHFKIDKENHSFLLIASDGIFDVMDEKDIGRIVWNTFKREAKEGVSISANSIDWLVKKATENVIKRALMKGSTDNVSVLLILFEKTIQFLNQLWNPANLYYRMNSDVESKIKVQDQDTEFDRLI